MKEAIKIRQRKSGSIDLGAFIETVTPEYEAPRHLGPLLDVLETASANRLRYHFSVPPRHGKSETLLHSIALTLARNPRARIAYCTHTHAFGAKQSKRAKRLAREAGVEIESGSNRADEWQTTAGGGLVSRGVDGELTGRGFDLMIVDDPIKSRAVAESATQREAIYSWFTSDAFTRLSPSGSIVVVHTRWHPDDLIGRLTDDPDWQGEAIKAIGDDGAALWPGGGWTVDVLANRRRHVGEYNWFSLYQGEPRPRGGQVFSDPAFYDALPAERYSVVYGIDLAYTKKTHADYSVCLRLIRCGELLYVADVQRKQVDAPAFLLTLTAMQARCPGRMIWHASGTEKGAAQFIRQKLKRLEVWPATADKFVRSQGVAAAWGAGRVLVPRSAPWLDAFLAEVCSFTGIDDAHDDQVDALASAFEALHVSSGSYTQTRARRGILPKRRM